MIKRKYDSSHEGRNAVKERHLILQELIKRTVELESARKQLSEEIHDVEKNLRSRTRPDFCQNKGALTMFKIHGYFITKVNISELNDNTKVYTAFCEENGHPFKISVTKSEDKVTNIDVMLAEHTTLFEIQSVLHELAECKCPHLILITITQFIHLNIFREKVITEKLQAFSRNFFNVYRAALGENQRSSNCYTITACRGTVEIQWTMVWDQTYHSMVHNFRIPSIDNTSVPQELRDMYDQLLRPTFYNKNEQLLWDWWTTFSNSIASL